MSTESDSLETMQELPPSKIRAWLMEMRLPFLTASLTPVFVGTAIAWATTGIFLLDVFLLTLIAGACLHIAANMSNDYFDHTAGQTGSDDINEEFIQPFSGGSRTIQLGYLSPREVLTGAMVFFVIGGLIGVYLAFTIDLLILAIGVIGVGSGFFYTAPPFRFVKRGIGEIFIGLNFGILMVFGSYFVQTLTITLEPILASIPIALLISAVLYINGFPDFVADRDSGKRTIVVRLGRKRAAKGYALMIGCVYLWTIGTVLLNLISVYSLFVLLSLPFAIVGIRKTLKHYDNSIPMIPANVSTIMNHLVTGLLLTAAYIVHGLVEQLSYPIVEVVILSTIILVLLVIYFYRKVPKMD
ncbi:MAG: 1,4-dihydroxy-2-naphthoate octaprenyltransferase [Candidatus Thorarchaeota archaeon]